MGLDVGRSTHRLAVACGLCLALLLFCGFVTPLVPTAHAQEGDPPPASTEENKGDASGGAAAPAGKPNLFWHIVKSAGIVFGPVLLLISIGLVALIVLLSMDLRMAVAIPPGFVEEFTDTVNKRKFKEAFDLARNDNSYVARVLTAGMGRLQYGIEDAREASYNMLETIKASKDQLIAYLATVGTLGPLLGLVGTVFGMILSFMEMGKGGTPNAAKLADGVSHALVVTLLGVGLAVPAIFAHSVYKSRLVRIAMDTGNIADDLLTQMYHNSKRPGGPGAPAPGNATGAPAGAIQTR